MSISTATKSPMLSISQHFDSLIREVDILTEERLGQIKSDTLINIFDANNKQTISPKIAKNIDYFLDFEKVEDFEIYGSGSLYSYFEMTNFNFERNLLAHLQPKSMKAWDFLNETRDEIIDELNQLQKETFKYYETIRDELKKDQSDIESIMRRVFEKRFAFILNYEKSNSTEKAIISHDIHLIELDFYLNPNECQLLSYFIKSFELKKGKFNLIFASNSASSNQFDDLKEIFIDRKGVVIYMLAKYLYDLFVGNCESSICRVVRISRQELISQIQTGCKLELKTGNYKIDLQTQSESPEFDFSNMNYLSLHFLYNRGNKNSSSLDLKAPNNLEFLKIEGNFIKNLMLSKNFFANLQSIRLLQLKNCNFSNVSSDSFNTLKCLQALCVVNAESFSHIELKGLFKLKWLRLNLKNEEIPQFDQVNLDLDVFEFYLRCKKSDFDFKLLQRFNFRKLKAFLFSSLGTVNFDLDWLNGENLEQDSTKTSQAFSLKYLKLSGINSLKGILSRYENLERLDLHKIKLIEFRHGMFNGLVNLKSLLLHEIIIPDNLLPIGLFNGLGNLEQLTMFACRLKTLPDGLFLPLAQLKSLQLDENDELVLNANTFSGLGSLESLIVDNCDNVSIDVFIHFQNLKVLSINTLSEKLTKQLEAKFSNIRIHKSF